jgi:hypothetical protein
LLSIYDGGDLGSRMTFSILPSTPGVGPKWWRFSLVWLEQLNFWKELGTWCPILIFPTEVVQFCSLHNTTFYLVTRKTAIFTGNSSSNVEVATLWP